MATTGSVLCGENFGSIVVVGCADGNILAYNIDIMDCLFGYGADNAGGVNCLTTALDRRRLITGGDSGVGLLMKFD